MATKRKPFNPHEAEKAARQAAGEYLKGHSLFLPEGMDEEAFGKTMDAVFAGLVRLYAQGFIAGRES